MTARKHLKLGNLVTGAGHTWWEWRHPQSDPGGSTNFQFYKKRAQTLERGKFDFAFIADSVSINERSSPHYLNRFEPLTILSALAAVTEQQRGGRAERRRAFSHGPCDIGLPGHVRADPDCLAAGCPDRGNRRLDRFRITRQSRHGHGTSFRRQHLAGPPADPHGTARDQGSLAANSKLHAILLVVGVPGPPARSPAEKSKAPGAPQSRSERDFEAPETLILRHVQRLLHPADHAVIANQHGDLDQFLWRPAVADLLP